MSPGAFRLCPSCGAAGLGFLDGRRWLCGECGFEYFHNVAAAAGVLLDRLGEIIFIERAREPRKGKLGVPGGFVDPGERAEEAVLRECREEIGWAPPEIAFLGSFPNSYEYRGISYDTCDLFFYYRFPEGAGLPAFALRDGEAAAIRPLGLDLIRPEDIAFPSLARAIEAYSALPGGA